MDGDGEGGWTLTIRCSRSSPSGFVYGYFGDLEIFGICTVSGVLDGMGYLQNHIFNSRRCCTNTFDACCECTS